MWIMYAFGSALFAGVTAVIAKLGISKVDSSIATAIRTIVILVFSWLIVFIAGSQNSIASINDRTMLFLVLSGIATGGSWLCYFKALQLGDVNKVAPIDKSSTILTMILAFLFLGEAVNVCKIIAMIFIGSGTFLMITKNEAEANQTNSKLRTSRITLNKWLLYAILSAIFASLTSIFGKIGIQDIESNLGTAIRTIVVLIMAWIVVFVTGKRKEVRTIDNRSFLFICFSGITTGLSWLCYYKALQDGMASIVVPIDKLSIVVTVIFSYFFLNEKLSRKSLLGLILLVFGTLLLLI